MNPFMFLLVYFSALRLVGYNVVQRLQRDAQQLRQIGLRVREILCTAQVSWRSPNRLLAGLYVHMIEALQR